MPKKKKLTVLIVSVIAALAVLAGAVTGIVYAVKYTPPVELLFAAPKLTGKDCVLAPASGTTKRDVTARLYDNTQSDDDGNPLVLEEVKVSYSLEGDAEKMKLVSLAAADDGTAMLYVDSGISADTSLTVVATATAPDGKAHKAKLKVQVKKDDSLKDTPASPLEKEGWELVYHDEFDGDTLDYTKWSPYYLRHWVDNDERTKADYYFEDGSLVLRNPLDADSWSSQNSNVKVKGIMSYERTDLHKYGNVGSGAVFSRDIPTFDGYATKYGYFELRAKLPDTRDGSHFAWWMVGVQGDQNATAMLQDSRQKFDGHYSNETGEIDIIETYLAPLESMKNWRPVIHPNGTTDYKYHWLPAYTIPGTPSSEYHVYGFEWDETGTKFYVDGQLASESDRSPNYPMMTFLTTYATGGMGADRNIYPKDTYIDYFRVYKKREAAKPTNVILNNGSSPDFALVPEQGTSQVQMTAQVTDQFDRAITAQVRWKLSETVDGFTPASTPSAQVQGVTIDENTGLLTVDSAAQEGADVFVTAYVSDMVKQTYHVKLSKDPAAPQKVLFQTPAVVVKPGETKVNAVLYDQYGKPMQLGVRYQLSEDISAVKTAQVEGVSLSQDGALRIADTVSDGTVLVVTARSGGKYNNLLVKVQK